MLLSVPRLSFVLKLSVRTFAHSGVLFYMANANQQDYAVLQVRGGRLQLSCDLGKGPAHASLATPIADGLWHTVSPDHMIAWTLSTLIHVYMCIRVPVSRVRGHRGHWPKHLQKRTGLPLKRRFFNQRQTVALWLKTSKLSIRRQKIWSRLRATAKFDHLELRN